MKVRVCLTCALVLLLATAALGQTQEGYVAVDVVKVKPEKRAEFDAIIKKMVDANRRNKGDNWIATETNYGEWNTVYFSSLRQSYKELETAFESFMGALSKAAGPAGAAKLMQDFNNTIVSGRGEIRRRRLELSSGSPADASGMARELGNTRWIRTTIIRVRPGRALDYEENLRTIKAANDRAGLARYVSQVVAGQPGTVFLVTTLAKSLGDFDNARPLREILGDSAYQRMQKVSAEAVLSTETIINRVVPELSNPTDEVAAAAPDFWRPKPPPAAKPKTAAAPKTE